MSDANTNPVGQTTTPATTLATPPKAVHVDFNKPAPPKPTTPFKMAGKTDRRLKLFLWGNTGTHKTILSLSFPSPVAIDLEKGTELYGQAFKFDVIDPPPTTSDEIIAAVEWLATNKHNYRTLVIDPITIFWEMLQRKWSDIFLKRNRSGKGFKHEFYDFQVRDWQTIKSEWKQFLQALVRLDMNVIVTAREKAQYADGEMMKKVGETFDGEKTLPYMFDTNLHLSKRDGKFFATCIKDRSNHFPEGKEIENPTYSMFEEMFGKKHLERKSKPEEKTKKNSEEKPETISPTTTTPKPEPATSAVQAHREAINKHIYELIKKLKLPTKTVLKALAVYGATKIAGLKDSDASMIESKLEARIVFAQKKAQTENPSA